MPKEKIESSNLYPKKKLKYLRERQFYGCAQPDDFIDYVDNGITNGDILGYTADAEKSSGIFNENGLLSKKDKAVLRRKLRQTQSNIWHAVISFEEDFGNKYMPDYEAAMELLKNELPIFFKRICGNPDNIVWFAGLHENTDNQHIHFSFFENEPMFYAAKDKAQKRYRYGKISEYELNRFKVHLETRLTDVAFLLKQSRRTLTETNKKSLSTAKVAGNDYERGLRARLLHLYRSIPTEGRVSYNSRNMEPFRGEIKDIVNYIIKSDPCVREAFGRFCGDCAERDSKVRQICERQKIADYKPFMAEATYTDDIYRRLGDSVIRAALSVKRKEDKAQKKCLSHTRRKRIEKQHRKYLLDMSAKLSNEVLTDSLRIFEEYRQKLVQAEIDRLVEEGEIEAE